MQKNTSVTYHSNQFVRLNLQLANVPSILTQVALVFLPKYGPSDPHFEEKVVQVHIWRTKGYNKLINYLVHLLGCDLKKLSHTWFNKLLRSPLGVTSRFATQLDSAVSVICFISGT